ncbi:unnamed protein product [Rotaria magnacalcarata]|uniref:Uncharacterized protein n=1 Tax=Rotaria magnacalcarata TaxID=392030 RepID=A0A816LCI5_9BILA|nr:unnamed protein product [Rotaria magnacalcarata]
MSHYVGRTQTRDIQLLIELYSIFQPHELHFLIELNKRWSIYDPNRIQNMTAVLQHTFAFEYKESDIQYVIKYFSSSDSIQLFPSITVDMVLTKLDQAFHLNPYQSTCPVCSSMLNVDMTDVISVQLHTLKGAIHKGKQNISCENLLK